MKTLFLYDIDGTLLSTGGAGRGALNEAFELLHGVPRAFSKVHFGGRTDHGIVSQAYELAGLQQADGHLEALIEAYLPRLQRRLDERRPEVLPGVRALLDATDRVGHNALLTGNMEAGAHRKLRAVELWERFQLGAYGDDSPRRNDLVPVAEERARRAGLEFTQTLVLGDTVHDVACARAGGAIAVAVCTGWSTAEDLRACGPDLLIEDLESGLEGLLALVRERAATG